MIRIDNVTIRVGTFALQGVSFVVPSGCYGVLMGKTGSGKSTLLEAVAGLKHVRSGIIELLGRDVTRLKPADRGVGYVPQDLALFPTQSVREHLGFALAIRGWNHPAIEERVTELAGFLGLGHLLERWPQGLSGGESQRVALGRALSFRPRVLLLDEPLSALDEETREEMYALLRRIHRETGVTALHVTHSPAEARKLGERVFLLRDGVVRETEELPVVMEAESRG
jgi:molybdate transport system ATP-binding protein